MASTYTDNFELVKQGVGDNVDTWGDPILNDQLIQRVDDALGKTTEIALTNSNVLLTQSQWRTKALLLTGTISADIAVSLPLSVNSVGSATAVGGEFIVDNQTVGNFSVTVQTAVVASTGVEVPQGYRSTLYSDTINVAYADDQALSTVLTYPGNPNGNVGGTAGSLTTPASVVYDRTNGIYYICTASGIAAVAVWSALTGPVPSPQGYLTTSASTDNIIQTGDAIGATTLYYTPYTGNFVPLFNGTSFVPTVFSQLTLALSASQAANAIYDVYLFLDNGTLRIGFSPSWAAGSGGSVTAGSCVRGSGVGGSAIQRVNGIWLNTAAMTVNNGANTYSVGAQRGTCVGSVFIDSTQGQVTCHVSYGQSRKWGVWNFYNRLPIVLRVGDSTASWTYNSTWRQSRAQAGNSGAAFTGLAEEIINSEFQQYVLSSGAGIVTTSLGIGWNATNVPSGLASNTVVSVNGVQSLAATVPAKYSNTSRPLGLNNVNQLEQSVNTTQFNGTETSMLMTISYRG